MKSIRIPGIEGDSHIWIGESLRNLDRYVSGRKGILITDTHVRHHHQRDFPAYPVLEVEPGEKIKTLESIQEIYAGLVKHEADRSSFIVGVGGGVVCDMAGFAASTFMRGVSFGFVASTLLCQVDAGVGGKNGVNFQGFKNMVGVYQQPEFVLCDTSLLRTLPKGEIRCGLAEVVKYAAISHKGLFTYLEKHYQNALDLDPEVVERLVYESLLIKSSIVARDEKERGERMKLNFGHTFGHAIERAESLPHGEAVSLGMVAAMSLSVQKKYMNSGEAAKMEGLLSRIGLPTRTHLEWGSLLDVLRKDKKKRREAIHFVLLRGIGEAVVEEIPLTELEVMVKAMD